MGISIGKVRVIMDNVDFPLRTCARKLISAKLKLTFSLLDPDLV